jgi:tRNA (guanine37-N1)-methyltransferase
LIVPKEKAEKVRQKLIEKDLLIKKVKIKRDEKYVYFPVKEKVEMEGCLLTEKNFEEIERKNYIEILKEKGIDIESISIDFIGEVAIIRLMNNSYAKEVAKAIMETNKHVKTVYLDRGIKEDYRVRDLQHVAGERRTETMHIEYGVKIKLDVTKVYFSPRLAAERMRVAEQIEEGSIVIDMFAGVAPFSLIIAKYAMPEKIYAVDKNPYAIKYARENVRINRMESIIEVVEGDAKEIVPKLPGANHVIMNLPHKSFEFLPLAMKKGEVLHYYEILERGSIKKRIEEIKALGRKEGYSVNIKNVRVVGSYSPSKQRVGMEIYVEK